ncbi:MAG: SRPBCC family protein [Rhizomicrobium sp.]
MTNTGLKIKAAPVCKSVRVNVPPARAFEVFTARIESWWPPTHTLLKSPVAATIIQPFVDGRWYQIGEDKSEIDNGKVLAWEPPTRLILSWRLNSKFEIDEAVESEIEVNFIADGTHATRVELEHRIVAVDAEAMRMAVDSPNGWSGILESYMRVASG